MQSIKGILHLMVKEKPVQYRVYSLQKLNFISLVSFLRTSANSAKPDQMPQIAASDQVLYCLLTEVSFKI